MATNSVWSSDYHDPRWKAKRKRILDRDNHTCKMCGDTNNLQVHHGYYEPERRAWTYPDHSLWTLCESCHEKVTFQNRDLKRVIGEMHPGKLDELMLHLQAFRNDNGHQADQNASTVLRGIEWENEERQPEDEDDGLHASWYESGQKAGEGHFKDGQRHGLWLYWDENGQKKEEGHWKDGQPDGLWTFWDENGEKKEECHYKNGHADGLWTWWNENGQKAMEVLYKDDEQDGLQTEWEWHENGQKAGEGHFKDGQRHGLWLYWDENGQKKEEDHWKDGQREGLQTK